MERRLTLTPIVYSTDGINGMETFVGQLRLDSLLSNKFKQEYLEMCSFVRAIMSLVVVISNTFLLRRTRYKEAYICQRPDTAYRAVMAVLALCRG